MKNGFGEGFYAMFCNGTFEDCSGAHITIIDFGSLVTADIDFAISDIGDLVYEIVHTSYLVKFEL